jgi:hypothetical protein
MAGGATADDGARRGMSWRFSPGALPRLVAENAPGASTLAFSLPVALTEAQAEAQACQGPGGVAVSGRETDSGL